MSGILDVFKKLKYPKPPQEKDDSVEVSEPVEIKQCHNCKHRPETVCQICKQVMKPNSHCSQWSN